MFRKFVCASALMLSVAAGAQAQDSTISAGVGVADFDLAQYTTASVRFGHFFDESWGVEGEAMFGIADDDVFGIDTSLDYSAGVFGVYRAAGSDSFNFLFRAGYVHAEISATSGGFTGSSDDGAFAVGLAGENFWDDKNGVRFDYTYADFDDAVHYYGISYVRRLGG